MSQKGLFPRQQAMSTHTGRHNPCTEDLKIYAENIYSIEEKEIADGCPARVGRMLWKMSHITIFCILLRIK